MKTKKKTLKDFDQKTVIIQTPSFTTSKDFGYLHLSKFPILKTSIREQRSDGSPDGRKHSSV